MRTIVVTVLFRSEKYGNASVYVTTTGVSRSEANSDLATTRRLFEREIANAVSDALRKGGPGSSIISHSVAVLT